MDINSQHRERDDVVGGHRDAVQGRSTANHDRVGGSHSRDLEICNVAIDDRDLEFAVDAEVAVEPDRPRPNRVAHEGARDIAHRTILRTPCETTSCGRIHQVASLIVYGEVVGCEIARLDLRIS